MSDNKRAETLRSRPLPWDELRERRVFAGVWEALEEEKSNKRPRRAARLIWGIAASVLIVISVALFASGLFGGADIPEPHEADYSRVAVKDAGYAFLAPSAALTIDDGQDGEVKISQTSGQVRYEITRQRTREIVVHADHVEVRVVGTVFNVDLTEHSISVDVERGAVRVSTGARRLELRYGESFTTERMKEQHAVERSKPTLISELDHVRESVESNGGSTEARPITKRRIIEKVSSLEQITPPADESPREERGGLKDELARADDARRGGDLPLAALILRDAVKEHPSNPTLPTALFTLGNIELALGNPREAAKTYQRCHRSNPRGPLAEDAFANAADSWNRAGDSSRARNTARRYLDRYPAGMHATRMRKIAE